MPDHVDSVKRIGTFFEDQLDNANPQWKAKFETFINDLDAAAKELVRLYGLTTALPPDLGNIHDLPAELRGELSVHKGDELEDQIVTVINSYGGQASLDQILVGLYRKFEVIQKRRFIQNKLYRMEMVWSVDGKKGVYTTAEPNEIPATAEDEPPTASFRVDIGDMEDEVPF